MPTRTRVLLVDDHPIVISGIRRLLGFAADFEVVGHASNAHDAVESAIAAAPDLILLDLHLPDVNSADLCRRIRATVPSAQVVIFTAFVDAAVLRSCMSAGVAGVLLKDAAELDLVGDLRRIRSGRVIIDERVQATGALMRTREAGGDHRLANHSAHRPTLGSRSCDAPGARAVTRATRAATQPSCPLREATHCSRAATM